MEESLVENDLMTNEINIKLDARKSDSIYQRHHLMEEAIHVHNQGI